MELRELRLQRLPGLPEPFAIEGEPGLNLILGPNGSGKSSLTRAALGLLWPDHTNGGRLVGLWRHDGAVWRAERAGGANVDWQRDGQPQPGPPPLPQADQAASFRLGLLDVLKLAADASDKGLARSIRNQMAGGYDLAALLARQTLTGKEGQTSARNLTAAEEQVRQAKSRQLALRREEETLDDLHQQLQDARDQAELAHALRLVQVAAASRDASAAAARRLAEFPPVLDRVRGDDLELLERERTRQREAAEDQERASREIAAAEQRLAVASLPDGGPSTTALDTARNRLAEARQLASDVARAQAVIADADARLQAARRALEPWGEPDSGHPVARERLRAEASAVKAQLEGAAARDAIGQLLASPVLTAADADGPPLGASRVEHLAAGSRALLSWLGATHERRWSWSALLAALALIGVGVARQPWSGPEDTATGWAAIVLGLVAVAAAIAPRLLATRSRQAREAHAESGCVSPPTWTEPEVRKLLVRLGEQQVAAEFATLRRHLRDDLAAAQRSAAARAQEVDGPRLDATEWLHRNFLYHEALAAHDGARAAHNDMASALAEKLAAAREALEPWLPATNDGGDLAAITAACDELVRRQNDHRAADQALREAQRRQSDYARNLRSAQQAIATLMARLDLPDDPGSDALVRAYAARVNTYQSDRDEAARLSALAQADRDALARLATPWRDRASEALDRPADRLAADLAAAEAAAARQADLNKKIVEIQTRLSEARRDASYTEALLERDRARDALAAVREQVRATALRRLLLERLQQQHRRRTEPPVLQRARRLFAGFTAGRLELLVADLDSEGFRARDTATGEGLDLSQLSDGTRAQLLLAARLAYIQEAERGAMVPLFLDESLTASDPERFAAIGGALLDQIADEGRQVFYLTCDPADVAAWQQLLSARGDEPAPVVDLARVRGLAAAAPIVRLRPPAPAPAPAPLPGEQAADYAARLGDVPPLDVHAPADAAHLFHLLRDDLALLHRLLASRVATVGQVESLAATLVAAGALEPAQLERLRARQRVLATFLAAAAIGRCRPVPPGALTAERASTSSLLPQIEALLASPAIGGDAQLLLDALARGEVSRLQQKVEDEIAEWLAEAGYLDVRPRLGAGELRARALHAAATEIEAGHLDFAAVDALVAGWLAQIDAD